MNGKANPLQCRTPEIATSWSVRNQQGIRKLKWKSDASETLKQVFLRKFPPDHSIRSVKLVCRKVLLKSCITPGKKSTTILFYSANHSVWIYSWKLKWTFLKVISWPIDFLNASLTSELSWHLSTIKVKSCEINVLSKKSSSLMSRVAGLGCFLACLVALPKLNAQL